MEENKLILRAQSGDRDAFRRLVETYSEVAGRTARVLLANHADAEDAAQEAWLDAWKGLPRFQRDAPSAPGCSQSWRTAADEGAEIPTRY